MLRQRKIEKKGDNTILNRNTVSENKYYSKLNIWIFILGTLLLNYIIVFKISQILPKPLSHIHDDNIKFIEEYARNNLTEFIEQTGVRLTGSHNMNIATSLLYNKLNRLVSLKSLHPVSLDIQKVAGTFRINFLESFVNTYSNVTNIIVKIGSNSKHSLLINCHYDSVIGAAGASDDAINCFIMIEILKTFLISKEPLHYSIIFLFNGAEEMILQGSHGFMSNHKWASSVKAVVNLDACGTPGRLLLFQSGKNGLMLKAYAKSVKYPFGGGALLTIYRMNLIPMQTDFYVFHKIAHIEASLDFAFIKNNYIYHTKYDIPQFINPAAVQAAGQDLLSLTKEVANSQSILADGSATDRYEFIYTLDFLGLRFFAYPLWLDRLFTLSACALVLIYVRLRHSKPNPGGGTRFGHVQNYWGNGLALAFVSIVLGWLASLASTLAVASLLLCTDRTMSWFRHYSFVVGLYHVPALLGLLAFHTSSWNPLIKIPGADQFINEASLIMTSVFCVIFSYFKLEMGNLFWFWIICALAGPLFLFLYEFLFHRNPYATSSMATLISMCPTLVPTSIFMYVYLVIGRHSIPILGLIGHSLKPDFVLAVLCSIHVLILFHYLVTFAYKERAATRKLLWALFGIFLAHFVLATLTPLGFPFSGDSESPVLSRQYVVHVNREFYRRGPDGTSSMYANDSGLWAMPLDSFGYEYLAEQVKRNRTRHEINRGLDHVVDCDRWVYCGMPYRLPVRKNIKKTLYIPASRSKLPPENVTIHHEILNERTRRLTFTLSDVRQLSVVICPKPGWNLTRWSMAPEGIPFPLKLEYQGRQTHFAIYVNGEDGPHVDNPYTFSVELSWVGSSLDKVSSDTLDIALSFHYMSGPFSSSDQLHHFKNLLPQWIHAVTYTARYLHYHL